MYTPGANNNTNVTFTWKGHDGTEYSVSSATVNITINPVNDAPDAVNDSANTQEDVAVKVYVLDNDTDAPDTGETLTITSFTQ